MERIERKIDRMHQTAKNFTKS